MPFSGHRAWIDKTTRHHGERCVEIRELLEEPRTAHTLVGELWQRKLSPINHQFALLEVMAHLEFMRRLGKIKNDARDGVLHWSV